MTQMNFTHIYHADWGSTPAKRWLAMASLGSDGRYNAYSPHQIGDLTKMIPNVWQQIGTDGCALFGFDFPIGIPESYARLAGITDFKRFLASMNDATGSDFHTLARTPSEISIGRPFYPYAPGNTQQGHLLSALGLDKIDELRRECEKQQVQRRAAVRCSGPSERIRLAEAH
jgi:hypothetical protein